MTGKSRFLATIERRTVDRPACWLGMPDPASMPGLLAHFGFETPEALVAGIFDDVCAVEPLYRSDCASAIYAAFDWYKKGDVDAHNRTLSAPGCFADAEDAAEIEAFDWPEPSKHMDAGENERVIAAAPEGKAVMGMLWAAHFQDTCASFGMENCLANMLENPRLVHAVNDRIVEFYLKAGEIFYKAASGRLDCVLIGNDLGSQRGLILSPKLAREFVLPGAKALIEQAHSYGVKVIYHSCGGIADIIDMLIEAGADAIHPIQALAEGMRAEELKARFGGRVSFMGGVDTQRLLVTGSPEDVKRRVRELRELFPTGLILSPSHEAVLPDIPPANIRAMLEAANE